MVRILLKTGTVETERCKMKGRGLRHSIVSAVVLVEVMVCAMPTMALDGDTYEVTVTTSFGTNFVDCFRFDTSGNLVVDLLGQTLTFDRINLGSALFGWQATSRSNDPLAIAFSGRANGSLRGDGISEFGETFHLQGTIDASCVAGLALSGKDTPY